MAGKTFLCGRFRGLLAGGLLACGENSCGQE
jgi:hypothetical protein